MKKAVLMLSLLASTVAHTQWAFQQQVDDFSDESAYAAITEGASSSILGVNCVNGELSILVVASTPVFNYGGGSSLRYRVDKGEVIEIVGAMDSSNAYTLYVSESFNGDEQYKSLLNGLLSGGSIAVEMLSSRETTLRDKFSLSGSSAQISKVLKACGS